MNKKRDIVLLLAGLAAGLALGLSAAFLWMKPPGSIPVATPSSAVSAEEGISFDNASGESSADAGSAGNTNNTFDTLESSSEIIEPVSSVLAAGAWPAWNRETVYNGGDKVLYQNRIYRAKWWTQGETPGSADVWEDTLETPAPAAPESSLPAEPAKPLDKLDTGAFRVVGYYPSWKPEAAGEIRYDVLTHVVYAFAIPTEDGGLRPLDNPETAKRILRDAHREGVKVLLAVGGWSYNDVPLEPTFMAATENDSKRRRFADAILSLCGEYGFDGVDMDWEHPRVDSASAGQYEALMLTLADALHKEGKVLTSAVLSGATPDGNIYYDAAAHSDKVLAAVDWIHVMAYDGGDGERHSPYDFAVHSAEYWKNTRQVPGGKITLGVPFYGRPSWGAYKDILAADSSAWSGDKTQFNGMEAWYNGVETIQKKTRYARENLGGLMIWEVTQDAAGEKSLQTAIRQALEQPAS